MKPVYFLFLALLSVFAVGCEYEDFDEEDALGQLEFADPFVRLSNAIEDNAIEVTVGESDTTASVAVIYPFNNGADVTVEYSLGGTATYGEIYTIPGASASGGSLTIPFENEGESTAFSERDIEIEFLVDTLTAMTPPTIELMLTGATAGGSPINVGQGGLFQNVTITLVND